MPPTTSENFRGLAFSRPHSGATIDHDLKAQQQARGGGVGCQDEVRVRRLQLTQNFLSFNGTDSGDQQRRFPEAGSGGRDD